MSFHSVERGLIQTGKLMLFIGATAAASKPLAAQAVLMPTLVAEQALADIPEAPSTSLGILGAPEPTGRLKAPIKVAPRYARAIEPEYASQTLAPIQKVNYALRETFSPAFPVGVVVSAGLSHGLDSDPKYGTNSEAFAKRVGASGARQASQNLLSDGLLAPLLRQDPRYYVLGSGHGVSKRFVYAATRVLISRTDSGHSTVNIAGLAGYAGSAALTQFYYPGKSSNTETILSSYGTSLGGLAVSYEIREFLRFLVRGQPR